MTEEEVLAALRELRDADMGREAPAATEERLVTAFRRHRVRRRNFMLGWGAMAAAAVITIALLIPARKPALGPVVVAKQQPVIVEVTPAAPVPLTVTVRAPKNEVRRVVRQAAPARATLTGFTPLVDSAVPFERGEVVRILIPVAEFNTEVQADVVVGQDGLARAIRFVGFEDN